MNQSTRVFLPFRTDRVDQAPRLMSMMPGSGSTGDWKLVMRHFEQDLKSDVASKTLPTTLPCVFKEESNPGPCLP